MAPAVTTRIPSTIKDLYLSIEKNFSKLIKDRTKSQEKMIIALHSSARDAFWKSIKEKLQDNNQIVKDIHKDLTKLNTKIENDLKEIEDITATIKLLTEGVRLAGSIVTLAAV